MPWDQRAPSSLKCDAALGNDEWSSRLASRYKFDEIEDMMSLMLVFSVYTAFTNIGDTARDH